MFVLFTGTTFSDDMLGRLDYLVEVSNKSGSVDVEAIKNSIQSVKDYIDEVLDDEDSEAYEEVEMWGTYECISEALDRLGYSYEFMEDGLNGELQEIVESNKNDLYIGAEIDV